METLSTIPDTESVNPEITIEEIQKTVAEYFGIRKESMQSRRRPRNIAFPRQIAMYLSRKFTGHTFEHIGKAFGRRDHGTVIYACKKIDHETRTSMIVRRQVEALSDKLS